MVQSSKMKETFPFSSGSSIFFVKFSPDHQIYLKSSSSITMFTITLSIGISKVLRLRWESPQTKLESSWWISESFPQESSKYIRVHRRINDSSDSRFAFQLFQGELSSGQPHLVVETERISALFSSDWFQWPTPIKQPGELMIQVILTTSTPETKWLNLSN